MLSIAILYTVGLIQVSDIIFWIASAVGLSGFIIGLVNITEIIIKKKKQLKNN